MYDLVQRLLNRFNKKKNRQIPVKFIPATFQNPSKNFYFVFFVVSLKKKFQLSVFCQCLLIKIYNYITLLPRYITTSELVLLATHLLMSILPMLYLMFTIAIPNLMTFSTTEQFYCFGFYFITQST